MVDHQTETGIGVDKPQLEFVVADFSQDLRNDLKENGALSLEELLTSVYKWEEEYGDKVSGKEFEVLEILSLVLGASKTGLEKTVGAKVSSKDKKVAFMQSIGIQQDIVKIVIANLNPNGRPNEAVMKSLSLTSEIFKEYFSFRNPKLQDPGIETQSSNWQGVQGMVTTALLFHEAGWKVSVPKPEYDLVYEMDLQVVAPSGDLFAVDVTARWPNLPDDKKKIDKPFMIKKGQAPRGLREEEGMENIKGLIEVNVPPMRHQDSYDFYEDRFTGYPSKNSFVEFRQIVDKLT